MNPTALGKPFSGSNSPATGLPNSYPHTATSLQPGLEPLTTHPSWAGDACGRAAREPVDNPAVQRPHESQQCRGVAPPPRHSGCQQPRSHAPRFHRLLGLRGSARGEEGGCLPPGHGVCPPHHGGFTRAQSPTRVGGTGGSTSLGELKLPPVGAAAVLGVPTESTALAQPPSTSQAGSGGGVPAQPELGDTWRWAVGFWDPRTTCGDPVGSTVVQAWARQPK